MQDNDKARDRAVRLTALDGLWGVAAMLVMAYHFAQFWGDAGGEWRVYGAMGVELFFIISGFVILLTAERVSTVTEFATARMARIYPAWPVHLPENKISPALLREAPQAWRRGLLERIGARLGDRVRIGMRGRLSEEDLPRDAFDAVLRRQPNVRFDGPYRSPDDLAALYGGVHFNWSLDYTDAGWSSDWLLPNRVYERGFFGFPAVARADTATGRYITEHRLGHALPEPVEDAFCDLLGTLTRSDYAASRRELLDRPSPLFVDEDQVASLLSQFFAQGMPA